MVVGDTAGNGGETITIVGDKSGLTSLLIATDSLKVASGAGTQVEVKDGGFLQVGGPRKTQVKIGDKFDIGKVFVHGKAVASPATWNAFDGDVVIGSELTPSELIVKDSGRVSVSNGGMLVGFLKNTLGRVEVSGAGSFLFPDTLVVGTDGEGELVIADGALVKSATGSVGESGVLGPTGSGFVTITGTPLSASEWHVTGDCLVGSDEPGNVLLNGFLNFGPFSAGGATLRVDGTLTVGPLGLINGSGTLAASTRAIVNGGIIRPGLSPGIIVIEGDYQQTADGVLKMEAAGLSDGQFDVLHVTGKTSLGGRLEVRFLNGYVPRTGDLIPFLKLDGPVTGDFAQVTFPQLVPGFQVKREIVNGSYRLTALNDAVLATPTFEPAVLATSTVTLNTWKLSGHTFAYVKLTLPDAGFRIPDSGSPVQTSNTISVDARVEHFTGESVQAVTTTAMIYDLGPLADGNYTFTFKNSGTVVKSQGFTVSSVVPPANAIDSARTFVKQQYRDFLNREADPAGENFWTDNITKCSDPARRPAGQTEAQCTLRQRETTSGAFFLSPEFQYTGYYVYRMYQGALGRQPKLSEFTPDAQFVGAGILVNGQLSAAKINQNKADFAQQFVNCTNPTKYRCSEFKAIYDGLNNQQYVDKLFQTTGVNASATDRAALVNGLNAIPATETRASVLQKVVDGITVLGEGNQQFTTTYGQAFYNSELNRAFVLLEYFGYMKRDPDDAGYAFWLGKLNQFNGNFVNAEMVLAFISSPEYRARFGQP